MVSKEEYTQKSTKNIENPEIDPQKYAKLIFGKSIKQFSGGRIAFPTNGTGVTEYPKIKI